MTTTIAYPGGLHEMARQSREIENAVLAEREACAKIADEAYKLDDWIGGSEQFAAAECIARAIRERGTKPVFVCDDGAAEI